MTMTLRRPGGATLHPEQVLEIRRLLRAGLTAKAVARRFNQTTSNIYIIEKRKSWANLPDIADNERTATR